MLPLRCVWQRYCRASLTVLWELLRDGLQFLNVAARSRTVVAAEVLFLRKQLAYYRDHQIRPRRLTDAARLSLVLCLSKTSKCLRERDLSFFIILCSDAHFCHDCP